MLDTKQMSTEINCDKFLAGKVFIMPWRMGSNRQIKIYLAIVEHKNVCATESKFWGLFFNNNLFYYYISDSIIALKFGSLWINTYITEINPTEINST